MQFDLWLIVCYASAYNYNVNTGVYISFIMCLFLCFSIAMSLDLYHSSIVCPFNLSSRDCIFKNNAALV